MSESHEIDKPKLRIVVVGAGFAGLELMKNLNDENLFEVIGLEGRDRVGGRVTTDENGNEIGAAWIHGTERRKVENDPSTLIINPVYERALEVIDPEDLYKTDEFVAVSSDGSDLRCDYDMWENMWKALKVIKSSKEAQRYAFKPTSKSVYQFIFENFSSVFEHVQSLDVKAVLKTVIEWQSYYATLWDHTSIGSMAVDREFDGPQLLIKNGGYSRILRHYLEDYGLKDKIRFNSPVYRIEKQENGKSRVYIEGQETIDEVDVVVVTVPLGVLKNNVIEFVPPLPERKQTAIDRLGFGTYDKIFVTFEEPIEQESGSNKGFWIPGAHTIAIVPKADDDYEQYLLAVNPELLEGKNPEDVKRRPYHSRDEGHIGIEIANVSAITGEHKIAMLIYGPAAEYMESIAHDKEALKNFALSKLQNAFKGREIPTITNVQATTWKNDRFSFGSFAHIPVGSSGMDMVNLADPIDGHRILFAGEATYYLHYSTVHGALLSGRREYARIMSELYPDRFNKYENLLSEFQT